MGSTVVLYVCDGPEEGEIEVPDFKGMTEKEAMKKLIELKLLPGAVSYVKDKAERGTIIKQSVEKDTKVLENTRIGLTVSGGPDYDPNNPDGTTAPEEDTTVPEEDTTAPEEDTTAPEETTAPDETTSAEDTTAPEEATGDAGQGGNDIPAGGNDPE